MKAGAQVPANTRYSSREALCILAVILATTVTLSLVVTPLNQIADPVRRSLAIDDVQFSYLLGAFAAIPSMAMTVIGGWLADRMSRRRLLATAMLIWTLGAIASAFASSFEMLMAARLLVATAAGAKFPVVMTWIAEAFPPERRGRAIGGVFTFIGIGPAVGATLSGVVIHAAQQGQSLLSFLDGLEPWRTALLLLALPNFLVIPCILLLPERGKDDGSTRTEQTGDGRSASLLLLGIAMLATALVTLADNANLSWLPTILSRQHNLDAREVGIAFGAVVAAAGILGPLFAGIADGPVSRWYGAPGRMIVCAAAALLCAPLLASFVDASSSQFLAALALNGVLTMLATTMGFVAFQALLSPAHRGAGIGIAQAVNNLAAAAAPTIVALVAAMTPAKTGAIGHGMAWVASGGFVSSAVAWIACAYWISRRRDDYGMREAIRTNVNTAK